MAYADVSSDMASELPLEQVIQNALDEGLTIEQIVEQMLTASPDNAAAIIAAAVAAQPDASTSIAQVAIAFGIDPAIVQPLQLHQVIPEMHRDNKLAKIFLALRMPIQSPLHDDLLHHLSVAVVELAETSTH